MAERKKERILYWDILKGIGIVSIVFGHSQNLGILIRIAYFYHLAVFFFVSGYFYNEERYGDKPFEFFARRLQNMWVPYVSYGLLFVVLHNFLTKHLFFAGEIYGSTELFASAVNTLLLNCTEGPSGTLWFVPVMLGTGAGFAFLIWLCRSFLKPKLRPWALGALCILAGLAGIKINHKGLFLAYHLQTSILVLPVYYMGYFLRVRGINVKKYVTWYGALASVGVFWLAVHVADASVELSVNAVPKGILFFVISFAGIYLCCFAAGLLERIPKVREFAALLGTHSFDIMALHFLVFKVIDGFYGRLLKLPAENYHVFPHSYSELHVVYLILGVLLPLLFAVAAKKVIREAGICVRKWAES